MYSSDYDQGCILAKQPIQQWCPPQSKSIYEFRAMLSYKNQFSYMVQSLQLCSPQSERMHEFRAAQIHGTTHSTVMSFLFSQRVSMRSEPCSVTRTSSLTWSNPFNSDVLLRQSIYEFRAMFSYKDKVSYMAQPLQQWSTPELKTQKFQYF